MKTFIHLIFTFFISTMALMAALGNRYGWILYLITLAVWTWFFWALNRRLRKRDERRGREKLFENYMRSQLRRNQGY